MTITSTLDILVLVFGALFLICLILALIFLRQIEFHLSTLASNKPRQETQTSIGGTTRRSSTTENM